MCQPASSNLVSQNSECSEERHYNHYSASKEMETLHTHTHTHTHTLSRTHTHTHTHTHPHTHTHTHRHQTPSYSTHRRIEDLPHTHLRHTPSLHTDTLTLTHTHTQPLATLICSTQAHRRSTTHTYQPPTSSPCRHCHTHTSCRHMDVKRTTHTQTSATITLSQSIKAHMHACAHM